jgi:inosine/xanthosine triphosphatase
MQICVGSLNPVKYLAVKAAFKIYFNNFEIYQINADSKVSDQPIGNEMILNGAFNRAKDALNFLRVKKNVKSNIFGIGIEAGLVNIPLATSKYIDFQFCVIMDKMEKITIGSGVGFEYPKFIIEKVLSRNVEIGEIMGTLANNKDLKFEEGAIGYLSKNQIKREDILKQAVICALLPRINQKLYNR